MQKIAGNPFLKAYVDTLATTFVSAVMNYTPKFEYEAKNVVVLFRCLMTLECKEQLLSYVQGICARPNSYPIVGILVPACKELFKEYGGGNEPLQQLIAYCISSLEVSTSCEPSMDADWSQDVTLSCTCYACREVVEFLKHPTEEKREFYLKLSHLEHQLYSNNCSVTLSNLR